MRGRGPRLRREGIEFGGRGGGGIVAKHPTDERSGLGGAVVFDVSRLEVALRALNVGGGWPEVLLTRRRCG